MMILNCNICNILYKTYPSRQKIGRGLYCSRKCSYKGLKNNKNALGHRGIFGKVNVMWKGDKASYGAKHYRIETRLGNPRKCELCFSENKRKYEWASKTHKYLNDLKDWMRVCTSCHRKYDIENNQYNIAFLNGAASSKIRNYGKNVVQ